MDKPLKSKVAIVGLGYVGLPLSLQFARSGVQVLGLDIDPDKVTALNEGRSYIKHVPRSNRRAGECRTTRRQHRFFSRQGGRRGDHLRSDSAQ